MRRARRNWILAGLLIVASAVTIGLTLAQTVQIPTSQLSGSLAKGPGSSIEVSAQGVRYVVDPAKLVDCGPPEDGIPSIDQPAFVPAQVANGWIQDDELVLTLLHKGEARAYPLQVLVWHEIVNDVIAGDPILVSYCPLAGSGMAYLRTLDGAPVEFGTSGKLYNSNLVMYDRVTGSYWTQIDGLAIVGNRSGDRLARISVNTVTWGAWKASHPDTLVLDRETGFDRPYGHEPYGGYNEDSYVWFPVENRDDRLHPKTAVIGIEVNGTSAAYPEHDLDTLGVIEDRVGGLRVRLERDSDGCVRVTCPTTGEVLSSQQSFWFAWIAFHPDTELYQAAAS